jgi:hypothetical protein
MESDYSVVGVYLGKRQANDLYLQTVDKYLPFDATHHVVSIDGDIFHLQTSNGDKSGVIRVLKDYEHHHTQFTWTKMGVK